MHQEEKTLLKIILFHFEIMGFLKKCHIFKLVNHVKGFFLKLRNDPVLWKQ